MIDCYVCRHRRALFKNLKVLARLRRPYNEASTHDVDEAKKTNDMDQGISLADIHPNGSKSDNSNFSPGAVSCETADTADCISSPGSRDVFAALDFTEEFGEFTSEINVSVFCSNEINDELDEYFSGLREGLAAQQRVMSNDIEAPIEREQDESKEATLVEGRLDPAEESS
jgi:hypothetical protein